jgi:lysophospholipase L1-like esterase
MPSLARLHNTMKHIFKLALICAALNLTGAARAQEKPTLWLIGDSTVNNGTPGQKGWGSVIAPFFDETKINVVNRARGGRSSRTFYTEGLWDAVLKEVKAGDFVLMQFGHNDGGSLRQSTRASLKGNGEETQDYTDEKNGKTETVHTFGWYLRKYIADTKAKGATPIVLSLIPRNDWKDGKVMRAFPGYGQMAKDAAQTGGGAFVDLNGIIADKYDALGEAAVKPFFPNEHTHTNQAGAEINAQSVVEGLMALKDSPFAPYLSDKGRALAAAKADYVVN